jgi:hypothetical protein
MKGRSVTFILALLILAGLALRIYTAIGRYERGDSIIVALMANDIAQGVEYPLWYYSGAYAGALEAWLTAPLIWLTGPSWWVIPFAPLVISTAGIAAFYMLGSAIGGSRTGLFAATLWAFAPWGASFYNVSPRGCYPETICGGAMILWYATRRWQGERMSIATSFAIGILAGLLIWLRLLAVPSVITLVIILLLVDRAKFFNSRNMAGLAGILIGALPFLFAWKRVMEQKAIGAMVISGMGERVRALYNTMMAGYMPDGTPGYWIAAAAKASIFFSLGATLVFIAIAVFTLARLSKNPRQVNTVPLTLFTFIFAGIYLVDTASLTSQVRYSLPLYTSLVVFPALAADWLALRSRFLGVAVIIFLAGSATTVSKINFAAVKREEAPMRDRVQSTVAQLENLGARSAVIHDFINFYNDDYNLTERFFYEALTRGYPLDVMQNNGNLNLRWTMAVERDPDPVYLLGKKQTAKFTQWLKSCCGGDHVNHDFGKYAGIHKVKIVSWPSVAIPPSVWNIPPERRALADRVHTTTMYSNTRQEVVVMLDRPRDLTKVRLIYGDRFPETVTLERSADGVSWERISGPQLPSILYPVGERVYERLGWEFDREYEEWNFPPKPTTRLRVTFDPHGDETYDLHELFLYESSGETYPEPSPDEIRQTAERAGVVTLACDRRVASLFFGEKTPFHVTLLPFYEADPKFAQAQWKAEPGFAALVDRADASDLTTRLESQRAVFSVTQIGNKTLFVFKKESGLVWWTGFTLIGAP